MKFRGAEMTEDEYQKMFREELPQMIRDLYERSGQFSLRINGPLALTIADDLEFAINNRLTT